MKRLAALLLLLAVVLPAAGDVPPPEVPYENQPYDGRHAFIRMRFDPTSWRPGNYAWGLDLKWNHDYPRADAHLLKILGETTTIDVNPEATNILRFDDPELFRYPLVYLCEVGFWSMSEKEVRSLRAYLLKGGFMIIDDFQGPHWYNMVEQLERVLPGQKLMRVGEDHAIFDSFFRVDAYAFAHPYPQAGAPTYWGIFEDDDPTKRLMMIVNYNNDIGEYWEFSDTGWIPIDLSNEAYKLGVNYTVYGMTH